MASRARLIAPPPAASLHDGSLPGISLLPILLPVAAFGVRLITGRPLTVVEPRPVVSVKPTGRAVVGRQAVSTSSIIIDRRRCLSPGRENSEETTFHRSSVGCIHGSLSFLLGAKVHEAVVVVAWLCPGRGVWCYALANSHA